jgi:hypothetical protein
MPGRGQPTRDLAEKAERRVQLTLGYLVIFGADTYFYSDDVVNERTAHR